MEFLVIIEALEYIDGTCNTSGGGGGGEIWLFRWNNSEDENMEFVGRI